jgi:hypothetical protein
MKRIVCLTALLPVLVSAGQGPQALPVEMKALETTDEASFDTQGFQVFRGGFRCDASGNVFFVPVLRGVNKPPAAIVRASTNGGVAAKWSLSSTLRIPDADIHVAGIAADSGGRVYALLDTRSRDGARQVIASLDDQGNLRSQVDLSADEIIADRFAVFDSGDFLLLGHQKASPEPRLAVMASEGGVLRDVVSPPGTGATSGSARSQWLKMNKLSFLEPASDGNVYFAPEDGPAYAISPSAEVVGTVNLASPQTGASLFDLKISGRRLAALYNIEDKQPMLRWISVYDLSTRNHVATYGPVRDIVMCYRADASYDRFSLLGVKGGRKMVFNASPR